MLKGKRSFFTELLISFFVLLCIPIITIFLILWQSNRIVKEQVLDIESKNMYLYIEQLEELMENMKDICHTVYSSSEFRLYAYESDNISSLWSYDLRKKVIDILESLYNTNYYDVFLYYHNNDRIISGRYSQLNASDYYATYYSGNDTNVYMKEAFFDILKSDYKKPICRIINEGSEKSYLCMTMGVRNSKSLEANYSICVVLKPEYLERLLVMQSGKSGRDFRVYNAEKSLLFSNNKDLAEQSSAVNIEWENKEQDTWLDEQNHMIQIKQSSIIENYYVYTVSSELFWDILRWLRVFGYTGASICAFLSLLLAYRSAVRAYKPVENIMEFVNRKKGTPSVEKSGSEFSYIVSFMENQEKLLRENKKNNKEWFLHGLLEGKDENIAGDILENNGILFQGDQFAVCIIHVDVLKEETKDLYSFTVQNVFEELFQTVGRAYFVGISKERCVCLINISVSDAKIYELLQYGQAFLLQYFQFVLSIGYSASHQGIHSIPQLYKEAQEAIQYRFLMGNGKIISYKEIENRNMSYRKDEVSKIFMLLMDYVDNKKGTDDLNNLLEQLMCIYQMNEEISMDVAFAFKNEIVNAFGRVMTMCGYEEEYRCKMLSKLKNTETILDFRQEISNQIIELRKNKADRKSREDILDATKRYINEKYNDYELSVATIGKQMGMQGAHLSRIFKEKYGISMIDYISNVRIDQAKRLICEERKSVQEIAEKTGFLSSTVFIRTFKKKEGITPGKYKEMMEPK